MLKVLRAGAFSLEKLLERKILGRDEAFSRVADIIKEVRETGDTALCRYTLKYDGVEIKPEGLAVSPEEIDRAYGEVEKEFIASLRAAAKNIERYHARQRVNSWFETGEDGVILGQLVTPLSRVGIYVPGGKASYPSSVLMNALPARVAGVKEIVMMTPPARDGSVNHHVLVAAAEAGITEIYRVGGAQAVAALAYGTKSIKPVDKITGPGNLYVTLAKQQVYGTVGIDMLAGPSEVLVVADASARADYVAADILSQAEHDQMAAVFVVTPDEALAERVRQETLAQLEGLRRKEIAIKSLTDHSAIIITANLEEAMDIANRIAPEHLELMVEEPFRLLGSVKNAGAVFLGPFSPEPVGDYFAGPNHVLPTGGTARFYSPLGVDAFVKRSSVVYYTRERLVKDAGNILTLAGVEGLDAHANSVKVRLDILNAVKNP